jgi:photosystem II stability/assembly factor-like uncharacterized protein
VKQESGIEEDLMEVKFLDSQTGLAIGVFASLLRTEDGGGNWQDISQVIKGKEEEVQYFITQADIKQAGEEVETEVDMLEEGMPVLEPLLNDILFVDSETGWIVGEEGNVFHTKDGGKSWVKQESGSKEDLFSVYFKNSQEGWITGLNGLLLHTEDGGATWKRQECPIEESLFGIVVSDSLGYAVGNAASMMRSTDGGKTWETFMPAGITLYSWLRSLDSIDGKFVAIGGLGTILIFDNEDWNWKQIT